MVFNTTETQINRAYLLTGGARNVRWTSEMGGQAVISERKLEEMDSCHTCCTYNKMKG